MNGENHQLLILQFMYLQNEVMLLDAELEALLIRRRRRRRRRRQRRRWWVRPWLAVPRRLRFGHYHRLMTELRLEDEQSFVNFMRMPPQMFDEIVARIGPRLQKSNIHRQSLDPGMKIAITLRHLASGDKYPTLQYDFRVSRTTISLFVPEVCQAIVEEYKDEVISIPTTPDEWREIAETFQTRWNVPHACGALDGKHIAVRAPPRSGSLYHNYKGFFSVVLLALVDADYKFIWVDVGGNGCMSDAQIYNASELKECLEDGSIGFPDPDPMPNDNRDMPYFLLGDDAFGLRTYLMKPYSLRGMSRSQQIANYRISRGRRVVENAFGLLAQRWQLLLTTMMQKPETVRTIVETCVCLHNLMRIRYPAAQNILLDNEDEDHNLIPGMWRQNANMHELHRVVGPNRDTVAAKRQREYLRLYFNSPAGSVPWQDRMTGHA